MAEAHIAQLKDEQIRYNDDTWAFTGDISFKQNGSVIEARVRKPDRVRGSRGTMRFQLQNPPASINPGNLGEFDVDLTRDGTKAVLELSRPSTSDRYTVSNLRYD